MITVKQTPQAKKILSAFLTTITKNNAEEIKEEAQKLAPVRSGNLKRSITIEEIGKDTYAVGSPLDYAIFVEMGTRFMSAQSYLRKALYNILNRNI